MPPSTYDLRRKPLPHLAFGFGNHACAGIYFANQVCRIGLEELFESIPNLERDTDSDVEFWGLGASVAPPRNCTSPGRSEP